MKKLHISLIFIVLINLIGYPQKNKCFSTEYLNLYKKQQPDLENRIQQTILNFENNNNKAISGVVEQTIIIPVVFNIIHYGESEGVGRNLSLDKIYEQITIMNAAYSGQYGGVDTKIQFCLAKKNSVGQATTGVNRFLGSQPSYDVGTGYLPNNCQMNPTVDSAIKGYISPGFPNNLFLNIWIADIKKCAADDILGYSSFPYSVPGINILDGIVVDYLYIGSNSSVDSTGITLVHEAGHWLGLFHIFESDCNETSCTTQGDMICDTDAVPTIGYYNFVPGQECLGYKCNNNAPSTLITDVVQNFMDYQTDICSKRFTPGQKTRIKDILSFYRGSIYNQGTAYNLTSCTSPNPNGGTGGSCNSTIPVQTINSPFVNESISSRIFGGRFEANTKWLVTFDIMYSSLGDLPDFIRIYKREGCSYSLHQSFNIPLNLADFKYNYYKEIGVYLGDDEIIISSYLNDTVYIYKYSVSTDSWYLNQTIQETSPVSDVGTNIFVLNKFLFVLEKNYSGNNLFRVYHKNSTGNYIFHQLLSASGFNLPSFSKHIQPGNFIKSNINFNSSTFIGVYDPLEFLVSKDTYGGGTDFLLFSLNNNNIWSTLNYMQPTGMPVSEIIHDVEITKNFIYVLTSAQTGPDGSLDDIAYLYSYRITPNSSNPFSTNYSKQELINRENGISYDIDLKVYRDQYLFIDRTKFYPLQLFSNLNSNNTNINPNWIRKSNIINCISNNTRKDEFKIVGNLIYYGCSDCAIIYISDIKNIFSSVGYNTLDTNQSDFVDKKVYTVPDDYSTFAEQLSLDGNYTVDFDNVKKEFISNTTITIGSGTSFLSGSDITLKTIDAFGACNSIIAGRYSNTINSESNTSNFDITEYKEHNHFDENNIIIYPNPSKKIVSVKNLNDLSINELILYSLDNSSQVLTHIENINNENTIDINLENLPFGIYILKIIVEDNSVVYKKIIKVP